MGLKGKLSQTPGGSVLRPLGLCLDEVCPDAACLLVTPLSLSIMNLQTRVENLLTAAQSGTTRLHLFEIV